ncbi:RICIN domain-containing protein [Kitasatospora hibisci]|uniref:RICIN domain-containing protein n=1 Tax=Kitasatospora hibisci TaxID=3369522 RepID=UPI0037552A1C
MYTCSPGSGDNQEWVFQPSSDYPGHGVLMNVQTLVPTTPTPCLAVANWGGERNGLPLTVYDCCGSGWAYGGTGDHLWTLSRCPESEVSGLPCRPRRRPRPGQAGASTSGRGAGDRRMRESAVTR